MMQGSLARKLRVLRAERGLTQADAAKRIGIAPVTLSELERGKRGAYMVTLTKIASAYGVPVEELMQEAEEPVPLDHPPAAADREPPRDLRLERERRAALRYWTAYVEDRIERHDFDHEELAFALSSYIVMDREIGIRQFSEDYERFTDVVRALNDEGEMVADFATELRLLEESLADAGDVPPSADEARESAVHGEATERK